MKRLLIYILLVLLSASITGQNVLGYKSDRIERYIKKNHDDLVREANSTNEYYKYLKYTDGLGGTSTVYFFLSDNDRCTRIKRMYVLSMKDEVRQELDKLYSKEGEDTWSDSRRGKRAIIKLVNEEWYFTVTIEPELKE